MSLNSVLNTPVIICALLIIFILASADSAANAMIWAMPGIPCVFGLHKSLRDNFVSPQLVFWSVALLLFSIAPAYQFSGTHFADSLSVRGIAFGTDQLAFSSLVCAIFLSATLLYEKRFAASIQPSDPGCDHRKSIVVPFAISAASFIAVMYFSGGASFIWSTRDYIDDIYEANRSIIAIQAICSGAILTLCLIGISEWRHSQTTVRILIISGFILLICKHNPVNSPRYVLAGIWAPVFVFLFPRISPVFFLSVIAAGILLMPLGHAFRTTGDAAEITGRIKDNISGARFDSLDYDAMSMHTYGVSYSQRLPETPPGYYVASWITSGLVPRSMWQEKPESSGIIIGKSLIKHHSGWFTNLSTPPFTDLYLDFWIPGVMLGGLLWGWLLKMGGAGFGWGDSRQLGYRKLLGLLLIGFSPIIIRGSLGSVGGTLFWTFLAAFLSLFISMKKTRHQPAQSRKA